MNGTDSAADESCAEVANYKLNNGRIATTAKIAKLVHGHIVTVPEVQLCLSIARIKFCKYPHTTKYSKSARTEITHLPAIP
jgi:hypothetical protein